jgi:DNA-binding GntR family transcriptional regulator
LAGNKTLAEVISGLRQKILLYRYRQIEQPGRLQRSMEEHRSLHAAFRKRDPDAAESLMKEHLLKQCEALEGVYADIVDAGRHKRQ